MAERMAAKGWTAPDWPAEYGGGSKAECKVLREEMARIQARSPLDSFGIWMIGPHFKVWLRGSKTTTFTTHCSR